MSSAFGRIAAGLGRRRRRWARALRWLPTVALVVLGILVFIPGTDDDLATDNIWLSAALPIWLLAGTWPLWRAPDRDAPEGLRWRRRHRRACWRGSALLLFGSCFALISCAYWEWRRDGDSGYDHYDHLNHLASVSGTTALWLLLFSPLPGLLDFPLWRLWPAPLRRAATLGVVAEELMKPNRFQLMYSGVVPAPGFDPDRGWLGRPMPTFERRPRSGRGAPLTIRPRIAGRKRKNPVRDRDAALVWDGEAITFTDDYGRSVTVPIERAAEMVEVRESIGSSVDSVLMLLDADGRWLASMPEPGFFQHEAATLAVTAGIPFAGYELGRSESRVRSLRPRLFPAAPGSAVLPKR
ncbi:hypothetical protein [Streptacidiphilus sp. PAMC 29251]